MPHLSHLSHLSHLPHHVSLLLSRTGVAVVASMTASGAAIAADGPTPSSLLGDKTEITVGAAAQLAPRYAGADRTRLQPAPVLVVQRGVFFLDTTRGAGLQFQTDWGLYGSQSMFYDFGRLQRDSDWRPGDRRLAGMGDVRGSLTTRSLLVQDLAHGLSASVEAEFALRDGARRNRYRTGVEYDVLKAGREHVTLDVDALWGDRRYNQAYFGVTAAQAASSRFAAFQAGGGLYAGSVAATWEHRFDPHWTGSLELRGTHYLDNAAHSPVVERRNPVSTILAVTYAY